MGAANYWKDILLLMKNISSVGSSGQVLMYPCSASEDLGGSQGIGIEILGSWFPGHVPMCPAKKVVPNFAAHWNHVDI